MLRLVCVLGLVSASAALVPVDQDCVGADGMYTMESIVCEDKDPSYCKDLHNTPVVNGTAAERSPFCFTAGDGTTMDKEFKKIAVADCAKTCGYCCLSPEWNCKNPVGLGHQMNCSNVDAEMCNSSEWRVKIAKHCPNKCGFCLDNGCVDATPDFCASQPNICVNKEMLGYAMKFCAKTCDNCDGRRTPTERPAITAAPTKPTTKKPATTKRPIVTGCQDVSEHCAAWDASLNGYCRNRHYTTESKKTVCAKTCKLC